MPFAYVAHAMIIESVTVRIQDLLSTMMLPSVMVPAGVNIGDGQQVVHDSHIVAFPPADQNAADFFRTCFDCVPTREDEGLAGDADDRIEQLCGFSGSHGRSRRSRLAHR